MTVPGDRISAPRYRAPRNSQQVCRRACMRIFLAGYLLMQGRVGYNLASIPGREAKMWSVSTLGSETMVEVCS